MNFEQAQKILMIDPEYKKAYERFDFWWEVEKLKTKILIYLKLPRNRHKDR